MALGETMDTLIVISGVAGMTGSKIAEKYLATGNIVIGFDNFFCGSQKLIEYLKEKNNFLFYEYDINNELHMEALFREIEVLYGNYRKIFINCAAVVHTKHFYNPHETFETNVIGMKKMLDYSIKYKYDIYINCSTSEVYSMNSWKDGGVCENEPVLLATAEQSLRTSYATGKLITEFFMKEAVADGLIKGCSIRFANVYSPYEEYNDHIIPWIISSLQSNGSVTLLHNAKDTMRTFLHNEDSCNAVISLIDHIESLDGSVYNVGTKEEIYICDLVNLIAKYMGINSPQILFSGERLCDPKRRLLNVDKIQTKTGWQATVTLTEGIQQCIKYRLSDENSSFNN